MASTEVPKVQIMDFCAKNRFPPPEFERQSQITGCYSVMVSVEIPVVGSDEPKRFREKATASTKREAENQASLVILKQLTSWLAEYVPPDLNNIRQKLNEFLQRKRFRFDPASFNSQPSTSTCSFQCTVEVYDILLGKKYSTAGQGKGKKDAEKDAAYRMMPILESALASTGTPPQAELSPQSILSRFPNLTSPTSSPPKPGAVTKNFANYRSKLHEYCQRNGLTPSYADVDNDQNFKRFSTQLTIKGVPNPTRGYGSSKKEASEEAAKLMWTSLNFEDPRSQSGSTDSNSPLFNPEMLLSFLDPSKFVSPLPTQEAETTQDDYDGVDYMQTLVDKFATNVVQFVAIPFESDEYFYFASVTNKGSVPFLAGHGKGASEREAKNAAAKDCLDLFVDTEAN